MPTTDNVQVPYGNYIRDIKVYISTFVPCSEAESRDDEE